MKGVLLSMDASKSGTVFCEDGKKREFRDIAFQETEALVPGCILHVDVRGDRIVDMSPSNAKAITERKGLELEQQLYFDRNQEGRGFIGNVMFCLRSYVRFKGRAGRSEYASFVLFAFVIILFCVPMVAGIFGDFAPLAAAITGTALLPPLIAVGVRRFHDMGVTGWLLAIPFIQPLPWIVALFVPSHPFPNAHGLHPKWVIPPALRERFVMRAAKSDASRTS